MKLILEFDAIEEKELYEDALNSSKYRGIIDDILLWLRNKRKHMDLETVTIKEIEDLIRNELNEKN